MAVRDSWVTSVTDGDQLNDGFFNAILNRAGIVELTYKQLCINAIDAGRTSSDDDESYYYSSDTSDVDYANSTCFCKDDIAFCQEFDYCDDSSIDANIWSTSTSGTASSSITEEGSNATGYIKIYIDGDQSESGSASVTADDSVNTSYVDIRDVEVIVNWEVPSPNVTKTDGSGTSKIIITDGTTSVTIKSVPGQTSRTTSRLVINSTTEEVHFYDSLSDDTATTVDVSSLDNSTEWYIKFQVDISVNGSAGDEFEMTMRIYSVGYADGTAGTTTYQTSASTITNSDTAFLRVATPSDTFTYSISFDNGSNYSSISNLGFIYDGTSGTNLIIKIQGDNPTSIGLTASDRNIESIASPVMQVMYT